MDLDKIQKYGLEVQELKAEIQELETLQSKTTAKIKVLKLKLRSNETLLINHIVTN